MYVDKSNTKITANFTNTELYTKDKRYKTPHYVDEALIYALQFLRTYYGSPIVINSSYRSAAYNSTIPGSVSNSHHVLGLAIDFSFKNDLCHISFTVDIKHKQLPFRILRDMGIKTIGIYDNFIHMDTGTDKFDYERFKDIFVYYK